MADALQDFCRPLHAHCSSQALSPTAAMLGGVGDRAPADPAVSDQADSTRSRGSRARLARCWQVSARAVAGAHASALLLASILGPGATPASAQSRPPASEQGESAAAPSEATRPLPRNTAAQSAEDVHRAERDRFGFGELRPGASGNPAAPDAANTDEAHVGAYTLPPIFASEAQREPAGWPQRRAEIARLAEDHWVGRIPEAAEALTIVWRKERVPSRPGAIAEHWIGQPVAPDGRMGPTIDAIVTFSARASGTPALIDYTYLWPGGRVPDFGGPPPPDPVATALRHGFAHVAYRPQLLQADTGATMEQGIIGLVRWPRERHDWGALRAWGWGASKLREELARDPRIDGERISLVGHSRFGKAVLVAAAFDHAFADANVSSSGAGGAKLMRRDFGERWENLASSGEFHWFTPQAMHYAGGERSVADLPLDAHMLIALRAPRPLFITSGTAEKGDAWVDPRGMWLAVQAALPAWSLQDAPAADGAMPAPGSDGHAGYPLGWFQHTEGHIPWPGASEFYEHEARFAGE